ncbi:Sterol 3-beta-glucosyltransferase UGT80A2 [Zalerion maritima]|uniref:Sterol 3-beta-glucosyltransferase UGT80A2 n=1 Tax=Zalerion maritima TaxID=339359 RepID=A0AAD5RZ72_9PEZI|nr:Sterol 3-beta-glucosyltransferase UGT80A2 [Zalerion maritima]
MADTQSRTPSEGPATTESIVFQDITHNGEPATVIRDTQGALVYPSYVPPLIESATSNRSPPPVPDRSRPAANSDSGRPPAPGPSRSELPRASRTEPTERNPGTDDSNSSRPLMSKKFGTDVPRSKTWHRRPTVRPSGMKRSGTNVSYLNKALWEPYGGDGDTFDGSSSSSSDDEIDDGQTDGTSSAAAQKDKEKKPRRWNTEDRYRRFRVGNNQYSTRGKVSKRDGRLRITVKDTSNTGYLAKAIGSAVKKVVPGAKEGADSTARPSGLRLRSTSTIAVHPGPKPKLNIVIMVIGSRGDAQPFLKIGKVLKEQYGHRVRIATHPAFRDFVENDSGLEFFSVGGDPSELMAFMVKNPGMIPSLESVKAGDIGRRRAAMAEMFEGFWRACINATDDEKDVQNLKMMGDKDPFVADAIIANPPSFAHIHCAEALGIPLHLMFTFPYTPTQSFPHPLASVKKSNVDPGYTNFMSYPLVEMMVWQGLGDLVNDFRTNVLGLDPVSTLWAPGATYRLHVPFSYLWSPGLVPKPEDWGPEIDVSGFVFLDLASSFTPPDDLAKFLEESEEPPIYIGFGSIVVDDPEHFTEMIFAAVKAVGCRALVSKGWGGLGGKAANPPENIYMLGNTPHDWLFPKVRACVIHGGAGTTAIALKCGKPTMVVPFFGDQHFWGSMIAASGVGPEPVPYKHLDAEELEEGIRYLLTETAQNAAKDIAKGIEKEGDGAENSVRSFHGHLEIDEMRCSILEDRVAVWRVKGTNIKLSALAADIAVEKGLVSWRKLRLLRHCEWNDFEGPGEPVTGIAGSIAGTVGNVFSGIGGVPYRVAKTEKQRKERMEKKRKKRAERADAKEKRQETKPSNGLAKGPADKADYATPQPEQAANDVSKNEITNSKHQNGAVAGSSQTQPQPQQHEDQDGDERTPNTNKDPETASQKTGTTADLEPDPTEEVLNQVGEGVSQSAAALARAPIDLSMAVAQGFHNAPRLYGDETVRRPPRVTGIRSGMKAAGAEFVYGVYDGWTGVVKHPIQGAKENKFQGAVKGVGMGLTGFVLKNISALIGPFGYTLKGVAKQIERGRGPIKGVRRARIAQGGREWKKTSMLRHPGASPATSSDEGDVDEQQLRKEVARKVVQGFETLRMLEEVVDAKESQILKEGGLRGKMKRKRKVGRKDIAVGAGEAQKAVERLKKGESVDEVFGPGVQRGFLGERLSMDASARKTRQERSASRQREKDDRERSASRQDKSEVDPRGSRRENDIQEADEGEHGS